GIQECANPPYNDSHLCPAVCLLGSVVKTHGADWMRELSSSCTFHPVSTQSTDNIQDQWQPPRAPMPHFLVDTVHAVM
ncbi:hypothetical protein QTP86_017282, partial [Hemibagrus guttatus]